MKKLVLLFSVLFTLTCSAQLTPVFTANNYQLQKVSLTGGGDKFLSITGDTSILYNTDGSVFRKLPAPQDYIWFVSDKLFNDDTLIDYLSYNFAYNDPQSFTAVGLYTLRNETGAVLWTSDTTRTENSTPQLFKMSDGYKLAIYTGTGTVVYALPGTQPCSQCDIVSGIKETPTTTNQPALSAYPNPFTHTLIMDYNLINNEGAKLILTSLDGRELKSIDLKNQSGKFTLDTNILPTGVIIATLYDKNNQPVSKKLVKLQ